MSWWRKLFDGEERAEPEGAGDASPVRGLHPRARCAARARASTHPTALSGPRAKPDSAQMRWLRPADLDAYPLNTTARKLTRLASAPDP